MGSRKAAVVIRRPGLLSSHGSSENRRRLLTRVEECFSIILQERINQSRECSSLFKIYLDSIIMVSSTL